MTEQELEEIKASAKNHGGSAECVLRLIAEIERLRALTLGAPPPSVKAFKKEEE